MDDKIIRLYTNFEKRQRLDAKKGKLCCEVSERWLQFSEESYPVRGTEFVSVDIMTKGASCKDRKLCDLVLDKKYLLQILSEIEAKEPKET